MKKLNFIAGLPRSGTTVLAAILRQNPKFYANVTSPVLGLVSKNIAAMSQSSELASFISDNQRVRILRGIFENYYFGCKQSYIFDTNRWWPGKINLIATLFPEAKVVALVRDVSKTVNSFERLFRKNCLQASAIYGFNPDANVYGRTEMLLGPNGVISSALQCLKEAYYSEHAEKMMIIKYETLVDKPHDVMGCIYEFIGARKFKHHFSGIRLETPEYDLRLGAPGLHKVKPIIIRDESEPLLPPDIVDRCSRMDFWRQKDMTMVDRKIV